MSFIGSMFDGNSGAGFQAVNADTKIGPANDQVMSGINQQQAFLDAIGARNGLDNQGSVFQQQQGLANQLQGVANGTGPNPALAQLQQATGQNVANQSALMAGQRGAGANVGLMARLAAQQGGNLQQQAVGQGATLQAQQQLGAMQQLAAQQAQMGNMANTLVGQQQTALGNLNQYGLQNQSNLFGLQSNANSANAGIAQGNQQAQGNMFGGLLGGAGTALGMIYGGPAGAAAGGAAGNAVGHGLSDPHAHGGLITKYATGGHVNGEMLAAEGAQVPGKAQVQGDSLKNDTVPATLSPGEIVIPRSIAMHPNAPEEAAKFVAHVLSKQKLACGGEVQGYADGGQAKEQPVGMPDPQKARDAWAGAQHGQSFSEGWENAKKFFGASDTKQPQNKAMGGAVKKFDDGGFVPDYLNTPVSELKFPTGHEEAEQALENVKSGWEGLKDLGSKTHDVLFGQGASILPQSDPSQSPPMMGQNQGLPGTQMPEATKYDLSNIMPQGGGQPDQSPGAQQQGLKGQSKFSDPYSKYNPNLGLNLQEQGLKGEAAYQNTMNQASLKPLQESMDQMTKFSTMTEQNAFKHDQVQQKIIDQMGEGKLDPNAYLNNMSGTQKVGTAIGLILGGMGGGLTHQENPAMKFLQSQIDRDVRAQEQNINNRGTLLNALERQYGDKQTALQSLYNIYSMKYENQMKQMAAENGSQLVQARLQQALGPLEAQRQQNNMQMGLRTTALQHMQSGGDASAIIPFIVPKEQQSKALEQYGKLNELNKLHQDMRESAEQIHRKFMNGLFSPHDTESAKQAYAGAIQKISEGRYNADASQKLVDSFLSQKTDFGETTHQNKLMRMDKFFDAFKEEPKTFLNALGVPTPNLAPRGMPVKQGMK